MPYSTHSESHTLNDRHIDRDQNFFFTPQPLTEAFTPTQCFLCAVQRGVDEKTLVSLFRNSHIGHFEKHLQKTYLVIKVIILQLSNDCFMEPPSCYRSDKDTYATVMLRLWQYKMSARQTRILVAVDVFA